MNSCMAELSADMPTLIIGKRWGLPVKRPRYTSTKMNKRILERDAGFLNFITRIYINLRTNIMDAESSIAPANVVCQLSTCSITVSTLDMFPLLISAERATGQDHHETVLFPLFERALSLLVHET